MRNKAAILIAENLTALYDRLYDKYRNLAEEDRRYLELLDGIGMDFGEIYNADTITDEDHARLQKFWDTQRKISQTMNEVLKKLR